MTSVECLRRKLTGVVERRLGYRTHLKFKGQSKKIILGVTSKAR
jgi:hypothetical protein